MLYILIYSFYYYRLNITSLKQHLYRFRREKIEVIILLINNLKKFKDEYDLIYLQKKQ
jgi:hypothetical protein